MSYLDNRSIRIEIVSRSHTGERYKLAASINSVRVDTYYTITPSQINNVYAKVKCQILEGVYDWMLGVYHYK